MANGNGLSVRPWFPSSKHYVAHVQEALSKNKEPWHPITRDELEAAVRTFPDHAWRWLPSKESMELIGFDPGFGRKLPPLSGEEKIRMVRAIREDANFRDDLIEAVKSDDAFRVRLKTALAGKRP